MHLLRTFLPCRGMYSMVWFVYTSRLHTPHTRTDIHTLAPLHLPSAYTPPHTHPWPLPTRWTLPPRFIYTPRLFIPALCCSVGTTPHTATPFPIHRPLCGSPGSHTRCPAVERLCTHTTCATSLPFLPPCLHGFELCPPNLVSYRDRDVCRVPPPLHMIHVASDRHTAPFLPHLAVLLVPTTCLIPGSTAAFKRPQYRFVGSYPSAVAATCPLPHGITYHYLRRPHAAARAAFHLHYTTCLHPYPTYPPTAPHL